jgi:hypothetical protein
MNKNTQDLIGRILAIEEMIVLTIRALPPAQRREIGFLAAETGRLMSEQVMDYQAMGVWDRQEFHRNRLLALMNAQQPTPESRPSEPGANGP